MLNSIAVATKPLMAQHGLNIFCRCAAQPTFSYFGQKQQVFVQSKRNYFATTLVLQDAVKAQPSMTKATNSNTQQQQQQPSFQYPKAEELYHRILARCETIEDVRALQRTVYQLLGKPLRDFEFYHDGFGGKKSKKSGASAGGGVEPEVKEVQKIFDVKLVGYDTAVKIKVIKEIRAILPGLGLKEAKELVESAPCTLQKGIQLEQAEAMKAKLMEVGAQIELV
jgi:large subunit ribosomal protein L7/L12